MPIKPPFNAQELDQLTDTLDNHEIAQRYNIKPYSVSRYCRIWGIKTFFSKTHCYKIDGQVISSKDRLASIGRQFERQYSVDESFFNEIDTEAKAWVLGFFMADGSINPDKGTLSFHQTADDIQVLELVKSLMKFNGPIHVSQPRSYDHPGTRPRAILEIHFRSLVQNLKDMGFESNKQYTIKYPFANVPQHLACHVLRGLWDGDGWLAKTNKDRRTILVTGSENLVKDLDQLLPAFGFNPGKHYVKNQHYQIAGQYNSVPFVNWLYGKATVYHQRKYQTYLDYWVGAVPGR